MAFPMTPFRASLKQADLHLAEAFCMSALRQRVDSRHRIYKTRKCSLIQSLAAFLSEPPCSEDKLKVRWNRCFDKAPKAELSTFGDIACGREWKTQPLIALEPESSKTEQAKPQLRSQSGKREFSNITLLRHRLSATRKLPHQLGPLSLWASSFSLSALSLMKPSASC